MNISELKRIGLNIRDKPVSVEVKDEFLSSDDDVNDVITDDIFTAMDNASMECEEIQRSVDLKDINTRLSKEACIIHHPIIPNKIVSSRTYNMTDEVLYKEECINKKGLSGEFSVYAEIMDKPPSRRISVIPAIVCSVMSVPIRHDCQQVLFPPTNSEIEDMIKRDNCMIMYKKTQESEFTSFIDKLDHNMPQQSQLHVVEAIVIQ